MINLRPNREGKRNRPLRKGTRFENSRSERGVRMTDENLAFIPADMAIRPLRDQMIVEPLDVVHSRILIVPTQNDPVRGIVKAIGPGHYRTQYDHQDKQKRTKSWAGMRFIPTEVKVGQTVLLDPHLKFEQFYWGDRLHIHARQEDVCGIEITDEVWPTESKYASRHVVSLEHVPGATVRYAAGEWLTSAGEVNE